MNDKFKEIIWNEQNIAEFWNYISHSKNHQNDYFSKQVGEALFNFLKAIIKPEGRILDYGCGPGYLSEIFVKNKIAIEGADFSEGTILKINEKFKANQLWKGAKLINQEALPYDDNSFDLIICLETIEHLLENQLSNIIKEFQRILKPQGKLFLTTPNNENLALQHVFCPNCQTVFHKYQHINSFNKENLSDLMQKQGFKTFICDSIDFQNLQPSKAGSKLYRLFFQFRYILINSLSKLLPNQKGIPFNIRFYLGEFPNLFWLGEKLS